MLEFFLGFIAHLCVEDKVWHGDDELEPDGEVVLLHFDPPLLDLQVIKP